MAASNEKGDAIECHSLRLRRPLDFLSLHQLKPQRYPVLLESSAHGTAQGRWDILCVATEEALCLYPDGQVRSSAGIVYPGGFLQALDAAWQAVHIPYQPCDHAIPFVGGWAVLLDYEGLLEAEPSLHVPLKAAQGPAMAVALRCPAALLLDHQSGAHFIIVEPQYHALLPEIEADIIAARALEQPAWQPARQTHEQAPEVYLTMINQTLGYLRAGDIFQANLSRPWHVEFAQAVAPAALFNQLRRYNPAPFAGLFVAHGRTVVSSSPERLVQVIGERVQTRPIAGTRPRDDLLGADDLAKFRCHPKERAEHIMLIDLERNDLGRICRPGTVDVNELMAIETYPHVHHLVSNVRGILRPELTPVDVIRAMFPGGTITGCPKIRCMQIIAELEQAPRGAYTGALGWIGRDGSLDLNILIRTLEVQDQTVYFRTGGGIVLDSSPVRELEETRAKAKGLLRALTQF